MYQQNDRSSNLPLNPPAQHALQLQHQQLQQLQGRMPAHMQQQMSPDLGMYDPSSPLLAASSQTQQLQAQARTALRSRPCVRTSCEACRSLS